MKKFSLTHAILVGGLLAAGGIAQAATTSDVPLEAGEASTMTGGAPNLVTNNVEGSHTAVLGAGPAVVYTTEVVTYGVPVYHLPPPVALEPIELDRGGSAATNNVPDRAGEASTMTGGVPNMSTDNLPGHVLW